MTIENLNTFRLLVRAMSDVYPDKDAMLESLNAAIERRPSKANDHLASFLVREAATLNPTNYHGHSDLYALDMVKVLQVVVGDIQKITTRLRAVGILLLAFYYLRWLKNRKRETSSSYIVEAWLRVHYEFGEEIDAITKDVVEVLPKLLVSSKELKLAGSSIDLELEIAEMEKRICLMSGVDSEETDETSGSAENPPLPPPPPPPAGETKSS